jgi:Spy/CpxP family protein refolding chaperone
MKNLFFPSNKPNSSFARHNYACLVLLVLVTTHPLLGMPQAEAFWGKHQRAADSSSEQVLPFVPAFVSPNGNLEANTLQEAKAQGVASTNEINVHVGEGDPEKDAIHLTGVTPNKTLDALRNSPKPNTAVLSTLSIRQTFTPAMPQAPEAAAKPSPQVQAGNALVQLQQNVSEEDLKRLWMATIDRNPVVRFALEKISLPAERHFSHSSEFMRKTLSVLVSGAAMASTLVAPTSGYQNMSVMTGGQVAQNYLSGRNKPISDLTPTEHIQLSYLIDGLKENLVEHYHHYQQALVKLNDLYSQGQQQEARYQASRKETDDVSRMLATQQYYSYRSELLQAEQKARLARTQLERIAGASAVDGLALLVQPEASRLALQPVRSDSTVAKLPQAGKVLGSAAPIQPVQTQSTLPLAEDVSISPVKRSISPLPAFMGDVVSP